LGQLGVPYSWGGGDVSGPTYGSQQGRNIKGFDCSGLTRYAYGKVGIMLPHYTGDQIKAGVRVSESQLKPGDLVFFYSDLHHMGMYIGGGKMVHAPQTGDVVKISPIAGRPFAGGARVA
jgi:cell wall-associated NlpC family hydrolase